MALRIALFILFILLVYNSNSQDKTLTPIIKTTACVKTHSSILRMYASVPFVEIQKGDSIVFDYVRLKERDKEIRNGDTITWADTEFFERVTFEISPHAGSFYFADDNLKYTNGYYEFHGGEAPLANTDFKIRKGFIKGFKVNGEWTIEASIGVVDRQNIDSILQEIKFKETFKNCN
jgi:hypothetical protein